MNDKIKYIILDFGNVLAYPITGNWFITPDFWNDLNDYYIDMDLLLNNFKKYSYILNDKILTEKEEYKMFYNFYTNVLSDFYVNDEIIVKIANDFVYSDNKYAFYEDVVNCLSSLKNNYKLILLSDNWPCMYRILKNKGIDKYFDKLYSSSDYGKKKEDGILFDYPINYFDIKNGEAIFVDDNELLLDIASSKGLLVRHMDRENKITKSKYKIINNLNLMLGDE